MFSEEHCKPSEKFLQAAFVFSDKSINYWKKETRKRCKGKEKHSEVYEKYVNWIRNENEIVVFTLYAYAYFLIPRKFDCIFVYENPEDYIIVEYELTQSIWEGYYPIDSIENGHKHLCVLSFKDRVPDIFRILYYETKDYVTSDWSNWKILGLCQKSDIQAIIDQHKKEKGLKELYGDDWERFYTE